MGFYPITGGNEKSELIDFLSGWNANHDFNRMDGVFPRFDEVEALQYARAQCVAYCGTVVPIDDLIKMRSPWVYM